jgi:hypothetical protein
MYERDRFINKDFSELSEVNISLIYDYQNLPVVSLEDAVKEVISLVPNIMDYVAQAKQQCNRNSTVLDWNESAVIYLYTMPKPFFSLLNEALRSGNRHKLKPWFSFLKLLTHALEKLPSVENTVVWRGVSKDIGSNFSEDDVQTWRSFNSCSTNLQVVECYLGENNTLFAIKTLHGKDISSFSAIQTEHEVVLLPGTRFRVKSNALNFKDHLSIVYLEELPRSVQEVPR